MTALATATPLDIARIETLMKEAYIINVVAELVSGGDEALAELRQTIPGLVINTYKTSSNSLVRHVSLVFVIIEDDANLAAIEANQFLTPLSAALRRHNPKWQLEVQLLQIANGYRLKLLVMPDLPQAG